MSQISSTIFASSISESKPPGKSVVEEIVRATKIAQGAGHRVVFISHHAFEREKAKVVQAGLITIVTAPPEWWNLLVYHATYGHVLVVDPTQVLADMRMSGIPILPLSHYSNDPDWPTILEAIIRLKLIDETAVFR